MKTFVSIIIAITYLSLSAVAFAAETGTLTINVKGLRNNNGVVRIAMFNSAENYNTDKFSADKAYKKVLANIKNKEASVILNDIPYGEYAIKLFHDEDNSGRFITGLFGVPKVEYGFSNNARALMGAAPYSKAKFIFNKENLEITIALQSK